MVKTLLNIHVSGLQSNKESHSFPGVKSAHSKQIIVLNKRENVFLENDLFTSAYSDVSMTKSKIS